MAFSKDEGRPIDIDQALQWCANWQKSESKPQIDWAYFGEDSYKRLTSLEGFAGIKQAPAINDDGGVCMCNIAVDEKGNNLGAEEFSKICPPFCEDD